MATTTKFNDFTYQLGLGTHNFSSHTIKVALTNTAPVVTNSILTDITQIANGGGYTGGAGGGYALTGVTWSTASGTAKLVVNDLVITATGASIGPFRYIVIYNSTAASQNLICFADYGSSITLNINETITIDSDQVNGLYTVA